MPNRLRTLPCRPRLPRASPARTWLVLAAAASALGGCGKPAPTAWQGYVEGEFVNVASPFAGRLDQLSVARGQQVVAGAPLFALENDDERAARDQAAAALQAAQAQLADLATGKRRPEVDVNRAQLAQARAQAQRSATQYARDQVQFAAGGIARAQLDDSRAGAAADAARVRELERSVAVARLPGREAQREAQARQVEALRAAQAQAEWKLSRKRVAAAQGGLVYDTVFRLGEWVPAGSPVVRMLPPGNVKVRFFVPEAEVGALRNGEAVTMHCDGCARPLQVRISYIANEAEYTPPVIYSNETRRKLVFLVEAHPALADAAALHPGQPVEVFRP